MRFCHNAGFLVTTDSISACIEAGHLAERKYIKTRVYEAWKHVTQDYGKKFTEESESYNVVLDNGIEFRKIECADLYEIFYDGKSIGTADVCSNIVWFSGYFGEKPESIHDMDV
jgi:hypothetical protein